MMHGQLVATGFQILGDKIAGVVGRDLPVEILIQRMNGHRRARNYARPTNPVSCRECSRRWIARRH